MFRRLPLPQSRHLRALHRPRLAERELLAATTAMQRQDVRPCCPAVEAKSIRLEHSVATLIMTKSAMWMIFAKETSFQDVRMNWHRAELQYQC